MPQAGRELIPAIVLAAGASTRMGQNKLLLPLGGKAVIDHALTALAAAEVSPIFVVLGHDAGAVRAHCTATEHDVILVENKHYLEGRASSVQAGLAMVSQEASGVLITPADVPLIDAALISALLAAFLHNRKLTFPLTPAGRGHPVIFPRSAFHLLEALRGEATLHAYMTGQMADVNAMPWPDPGCTLDIDTFENYARVQALQAQVSQRGD